MPNTTKGYPYPQDADPADVPADVQLLAEAVDATPGIASLTQAQIDALGVAAKWAGRIVWNQTTGRLQRCDGSTWVDLVLTNDGRLTDTRTPTAHASSHAAAGSDPLILAQSQITNLTSDLAAKAPSASPTFTGNPTLSGYGAIVATTGNSTGYLTHQYLATNGHDAIGLGLNWKRTDSTTGTIPSATMPTAEVYLDATGGGGQTAFLSVGLSSAINTAPTELLRVIPSGLISGSGSSLGAWTAYTPTVSGTGWALGNGTIAGHYSQIGKRVAFTVEITWGTTSTFGASPNNLGLSLPVTRSARQAVLSGQAHDISTTNRFALSCISLTPTTFEPLYAEPTANTLIGCSANAPFTWASTDTIKITGMYEAA